MTLMELTPKMSTKQASKQEGGQTDGWVYVIGMYIYACVYIT